MWIIAIAGILVVLFMFSFLMISSANCCFSQPYGQSITKSGSPWRAHRGANGHQSVVGEAFHRHKSVDIVLLSKDLHPCLVLSADAHHVGKESCARWHWQQSPFVAALDRDQHGAEEVPRLGIIS